MPHIANTPESVLSRSDSRNPTSTCRGINANGQRCRRALASPQVSITTSSQNPNSQQKANLSALYCWQHKSQAPSNPSAASGGMSSAQAKPRTSIDTLLDRLGVLDITDAPNKQNNRPGKRRVCCCFEIIEDEDLQPAKPVSTNTPDGPLMQSPNSTLGRPPRRASNLQGKDLLSWIPSTLSPQTTSLLLAELAKPISESDEPGYIYMFWVTPSTSPNSKPPPSEIARSLLPVDGPGRHNRRVSDAIRTAKDFNDPTSKSTPGTPGTVKLKIGRTSNVQRRLNEWSRQCSNHLTLIRYYPYTPSSASPSPSPSPSLSPSPSSRRPGRRTNSSVTLDPGRKVPHVHRVERLIHIELADVRLRDLGQCQECGKEHREWFEVAAEKTALRRVDECIRRWVEWAETRK